MNINATDLAGFLRSRKSADCKMAADWAEDNPDHPVTLAEALRLWGWIEDVTKEVYKGLLEGSGVCLSDAMTAGLMGKGAWGPVARLVCPRFGPAHFGLPQDDQHWARMEEEAKNAVPDARLAAWAATLVRGIKAAVFPIGDD